MKALQQDFCDLQERRLARGQRRLEDATVPRNPRNLLVEHSHVARLGAILSRSATACKALPEALATSG